MMALITALVIPFFMSTLLSTSALVPSNERWKVSSLSSKSSKRSSCLSMRFSCSSPLLSSMIRMLINVSLAVCSNLSISRLITHTPRPFSIIKRPAYSAGSFHNISGHCARIWLLRWLFCCWFFFDRYVLAVLVHTVGFRVALYNFVFIRVIHESCERILQLRQLFGAFKIAVLLRLVELLYGVKHSIKCIVPEQRLVSCVRIHSSNIVHSRFPCKFSH